MKALKPPEPVCGAQKRPRKADAFFAIAVMSFIYEITLLHRAAI
jgi:hypothetical protein